MGSAGVTLRVQALTGERLRDATRKVAYSELAVTRNCRK